MSLINKFLERVTLVMKTNHAFHKPTTIQIEPTNRCNLKCPQCARKALSKGKGIGDLKKEEFTKIIDQLPQIEHVELYGLGESLIHPNFFDMVDQLKKHGVYVNMTSNATVVSDQVAEKIIDKGIDHFNISVDGAKKETYEIARVGASFERVMENIRRISRKKKEKNSKTPRLSTSMVLTKYNINELTDYIRLGKELGIDNIHIQDLNAIWNTGNLELENPKVLKEKINDAIKEAKKQNIAFSYISRYDELQDLNKTSIKQRAYRFLTHFFDFILRGKSPFKPVPQCLFPWFEPYITWDGYVTPCCMLPDRKVINLGSLKDKSFDKIWNNKKYKEFRKAHASGKYPQICKHCILIKDLISIRVPKS